MARRYIIEIAAPIAAASGSAFAITKDGYLITNEHVVKGCDSVKVHNDGEIIPAKIITKDFILYVPKIRFFFRTHSTKPFHHLKKGRNS